MGDQNISNTKDITNVNEPQRERTEKNTKRFVIPSYGDRNITNTKDATNWNEKKKNLFEALSIYYCCYFYLMK